MTQKAFKFGFLSGNALKLIACAAMLCDHAGVMLFPKCMLLRIIGRIAFPIFAFMIAEGCRYTRNKLRYFLTVLTCGIVFQAVYSVLQPDNTYLNIFLTFSCSILMVYLLGYVKRVCFSKEETYLKKVLSVSLFCMVMLSVYFFNRLLTLDYGFLGSMIPVLVSAFCFDEKTDCPAWLRRLDAAWMHVLCLAVGVFVMVAYRGGIRLFALLAVPLLLLYSGKRGKKKMKLFFYVFYPAHLVVLWLIGMAMQYFAG